MSTAGSPKQPDAEVVLPSGTLPLTPPMSFSDSCFAPTDIRFVPPSEGYSSWTDTDGEIHVIYAPDVPLPLPPRSDGSMCTPWEWPRL